MGRVEPHLAHRFLVAIDGIITGGFTEISGFSIKTEVQRKWFGGEHDREYAFILGTKYPDLTLKHGLTDQDLLWKWYENVLKGKITRRNVSIFLLNNEGQQVIQWDLSSALPIEWNGPGFDATKNTVAFESLVLNYYGLTKSKPAAG